MTETKWTDDDFEELCWHDCQLNSIALEHDGEWQSDLVFDLDFIVEWLCSADRTCRFRVAPATLRFSNVDNLKLDLLLKFKQPLQVHSIERSTLPVEGYKNFHWAIKVQSYPGLKDNVIEFDATGFTQELTGRALETGGQNLTASERTQSKGEGRTRV